MSSAAAPTTLGKRSRSSASVIYDLDRDESDESDESSDASDAGDAGAALMAERRAQRRKLYNARAALADKGASFHLIDKCCAQTAPVIDRIVAHESQVQQARRDFLRKVGILGFDLVIVLPAGSSAAAISGAASSAAAGSCAAISGAADSCAASSAAAGSCAAAISDADSGAADSSAAASDAASGYSFLVCHSELFAAGSDLLAQLLEKECRVVIPTDNDDGDDDMCRGKYLYVYDARKFAEEQASS